ncbi:hypothetical protein Tsp_07425 [Trichinella spiralis]|uniref:hypothetical protein n=1 Tax=Trichinella spiralis TaxID=6334 RepID=UPI0001EFCD44|nr:hypothetical protein Tsp_07425 [Trichinella spiralis]
MVEKKTPILVSRDKIDCTLEKQRFVFIGTNLSKVKNCPRPNLNTTLSTVCAGLEFGHTILKHFCLANESINIVNKQASKQRKAPSTDVETERRRCLLLNNAKQNNENIFLLFSALHNFTQVKEVEQT